MSVITPKDLLGTRFSSSFKGYNKAEVEEYVNTVSKNYSILYRRCAELEEQLTIANIRLDAIDREEKLAKKMIDDAKEKSDKIISEIQKKCDAILLDFHAKVESQKETLAEMSARAEMFKSDLFEKYKQHIELIEKLNTKLDFGEDTSANEYVTRVIDELKYDIAAEYNIAVGEDDGSESEQMDLGTNDMPTEEEIKAFIRKNHDIGKPEEKSEDDDDILLFPEDAKLSCESEKKPEKSRYVPNVYANFETEMLPINDDEIKPKVAITSSANSTKMRKQHLDSVMETLHEYEKEDERNAPKIEAQLMLDLDNANDVLVEIENKNNDNDTI